MSPITTHVLDTSAGKPAAGVAVKLEISDTAAGASGSSGWQSLAQSTTNSDGRVADLLPADQGLKTGTYRLTFEIENYFKNQKKETFYPYAQIVFKITDPKAHYHVPLLISAFGFTTYRGS